MIKFLTQDDLFKQDENKKYVMDGQIVGFIMEDKAFAAKLTISNMAVYLCQTRIATETQCPDMKGMKYTWAVKKDEVGDYYMFQDDTIVPALVEIDKQVAEYYKDSENKMAEWDKQSVIDALPAIQETLEVKRKIAQTALEMAQKAAEKLASPQGAVDMCATLQEKATERYEKIIESWNK
jgi:glutamyl/glutaminyl-tRNA synthetase